MSAWSYGGSILTFVFPMVLFLTVALSLYVVFTKPSVVPGHREQTLARPIGFTPVVRMPGQPGSTTGHMPASGPQYAVGPGGGQASPPGGGPATAPGSGGAADPEDPAAGQGNPEAAE